MGADGSDTDRPARLGRRTFVKGLGATGAASLGLSSGPAPAAAVDWSAIGTTGVSYAIFGPAIGVGWALREFEVIGSDPPAEGLTADALKQQANEASLTRQSENASTIVDNRNILDGLEHTAYTEAKIAAIEELNAGSSESDVLAAANNAIDSYFTTVQKNYLKSWNESVNELRKFMTALESHADLNIRSVYTIEEVSRDYDFDHTPRLTNTDRTATVSLFDGTEFTVQQVSVSGSHGNTVHYSPEQNISDWDAYPANNSNTQEYEPQVIFSSGDETYLDYHDWRPLYEEMGTIYSDVSNGISTWVTSVYGDVQSGDIEISDLVTPRERAAMMAEEEGMNQAIADLISLNIPVDAEREATITIEDTSATLPGTFGLTDSSDGPLEAGTTYDPSTFSGDVYFTADMSLVEGDWSAINSGVDGGTITITSQPYDSTAIEVTTTAGETVSVPAADWSAVDGSDEWTFDASDDLETPITEVDSARFVSTATETQYETIQLNDSFTVDKLVNKQSGEEVQSTSFENSEPQTDSNYITQEEWEDLEQQNEQLIEEYENSQNNGGGIDLGQFDMYGIPGEIVAVVAAVLVALGVLSN